ncbi:MAG: hypothetical protein IRZ33_07825 [Alicyclobacillaceae bacterium]|nr:hypothetical protein [Alicyclobacillaceae bacterium]
MTEETLDWRPYRKEILDLCEVKAEEFRLLGYETVTGEDVWHCVRGMLKGNVPLHRMVEAVLGLQVGTFMTHATMNAYRQAESGPDNPFDPRKRG